MCSLDESAPYDDIETENNIPNGKAHPGSSNGIYDSISKSARGQPYDKNNNNARQKQNNVQREIDVDNMYSKVNPQNKRQKKIIRGKDNTAFMSGTYGEVNMLENDIYNDQLPKDDATDMFCTGTYSEVKMLENDIYNQQ